MSALKRHEKLIDEFVEQAKPMLRRYFGVLESELHTGEDKCKGSIALKLDIQEKPDGPEMVISGSLSLPHRKGSAVKLLWRSGQLHLGFGEPVVEE